MNALTPMTRLLPISWTKLHTPGCDLSAKPLSKVGPTPNIYILLFLFFSSHSVSIHTSWSECWYWSRWWRWHWRSWRWRWLWSRLGCVQRTGLRVGRACYQSPTHPLEPFNWDGDGAHGIYDAQHPIFNLYVTHLAWRPPKNKIKMAIENKSLFIQKQKRGWKPLRHTVVGIFDVHQSPISSCDLGDHQK